MPLMKILPVLYCCLGTILSFEISEMQYYFWFRNKIHEKWIVDSFEDCHMITCVQNCRNNTNCAGVALGPIEDGQEDHVRTCLLLANVDESECDDEGGDYDCTKEGFTVYLKVKPLTTTTKAPSTTASPTTTTTEISSTSTTTTTVAQTTTIAATTVTEEPTTTTTEEPTTTAPPSSTTTVTESPNTTTTAYPTTTNATDEYTTSTEIPTTTSTITALENTTTTEAPTTTAMSTETTFTTTEMSNTTTEGWNTTTSMPNTTTEMPNTTTEGWNKTTEMPSTTTEMLNTTTEGWNTTTEMPNTTIAESTSTTEAPTTTTEAATTSTTVAPTSSTTEGTETVDEECQAPPASIVCSEPKTQYLSFGLKSDAPLFSDANMKTQCKKFMNNVFKSTSSKKAYKPFSGLFTCADDEAMTGIEICFQVDIIYIAPFCTQLEDGYSLIRDDIKEASNSPQAAGEATCPNEMAMITLKLEKDSDGNIAVYITCAEIREEKGSGDKGAG